MAARDAITGNGPARPASHPSRDATPPGVLIGLDFAFALPAWFTRAHAGGSAAALWALVARDAERWLAECAPPFWGRPGRKRPPDDDARPAFRECERTLPGVNGTRAKSVFQVGGAGAVGTGSLRGMSVLPRLRAAGARIWPFDDGALPAVVEIYPRVLTGAVKKSNRDERAAYLAKLADLPAWARERGASGEDAFDALVSARAMWRGRDDASLTAVPSDMARIEGAIWNPATVVTLPP
ncbi:MAG: hypothetical protein HY275_07960 [Gemmatimonadetes bacterium]|nr:hypothetical protein [Gemmatimonadota bacterium]